MPSGNTLSRRKFCAALGAAAGADILAGCASRRAPIASPAPTSAPAAAAPAGSIVPAATTSRAGPTALPAATPSPIAGKLVVVLDRNLGIVDLATLQARRITDFPKDAYATSPRLSPDRQRLAFTYYVVPKDRTDFGGSDLYVADGNGANARLLRAHPESGASFEAPCWTADGKAILATLRKQVLSQGAYQGDALAVVRVGLDGSAPVTLVANAMGPAASPDGKHLVYSTVDAQGNLSGFWVADANGQNHRAILGDQGFVVWGSPSFAPDGAQLVFAAVGGPGNAVPSIKVGWTPPGVGIAEAHAAYWDVWTVRPDGADLRQITHLAEDSPTPTWSPDGKWIAIAGEMGLYVVDAAGAQATFVSHFATPGISWLAL